jgi:hypothetical protein
LHLIITGCESSSCVVNEKPPLPPSLGESLVYQGLGEWWWGMDS